MVAFIGGLGPMEMVIFLVIAVLLFGKRLPDVARSLGKGVVEFKKGIRGIEDEVDRAQYTSNSSRDRNYQLESHERDEASAPRFEPPPAEAESPAPPAAADAASPTASS
jgi:sec-independent protein translocase protein TatA